MDVVDGDPSVLCSPFAHSSEQSAPVWDGSVEKKFHRNARVGCVWILVVQKRRIEKSPEKRDVNVQVV